MNVDALAEALVGVVEKKAAAGQLELPLMPTFKTQLISMMQGRFELSDVVPIMSKDALLALECLRHLGRIGRPPVAPDAASLAQAVGTTAMRQIVGAVVRRRHQESRDSAIRQIFERICSNALAVATAAHHVAVHAALPDAEVVAFCGALSSVGAPATAFHLLDLERAASRSRSRGAVGLNPSAFLEMIHRVSAPVACAILAPYRVPPAVREILEDPFEYDTSERKSVANCVRMGRYVAVQAGLGLGGEDPARVTASLLIGRSLLDMRDDSVGFLVEAARQ